MKESKDYTSYSFRFTALVVVLLLCVSMVPGFRLGGVLIKRANIVSDIIEMTDDSLLTAGVEKTDTSLLAGVVMPEVTADSMSAAVPDVRMHDWNLSSLTVTKGSMDSIHSGMAQGDMSVAVNHALEEGGRGAVVEIEDFAVGHDGVGHGMSHFYEAMSRSGSLGRPLRIAVCGDSFIEGDILSADIRAILQDILGGRGVGFVPFASPVAQFRGSVKHTFAGWDIDDIRNLKGMDDEYKKRFFLSGLVGRPQEGATVSYKGSQFRKHLHSSQIARLLFVNEDHTKIDILVNDSLRQTFAPDPSPDIQQISVHGEDISSLSVTFSDTEGFYGYGVVFEDRSGVVVDNFSIRGNSGFVLMNTNSAVNRRMGSMMPYDLIILQYGLNVMSPDVLEYNSYRRHFANVIEYVKRCFPHSSVMVLGVGDRSAKRDGEFVTMPAVAGMIAAQKGAAKQAGVAFWNMFEGMGGQNSMVRFVEKNWAAKDYTHIGFPGGRFIARRFVDALLAGRRNEIASQKGKDADGVNYKVQGSAGQMDLREMSRTISDTVAEQQPVKTDTLRSGPDPASDTVSGAGDPRVRTTPVDGRTAPDTAHRKINVPGMPDSSHIRKTEPGDVRSTASHEPGRDTLYGNPEKSVR